MLFGDNLDKTKDLASKPFCNYNANIPRHLSNEEFEVLKNLLANCNLIIQKDEKGNSVVRKKSTLDNWKDS